MHPLVTQVMRLPHFPAPRFVFARWRAVGYALSLFTLAACDVPTSAPINDMRWVVPSQSVTIAVSDILPAGVSVTSDNTGFAVAASTTSVTRALSQDCPACAAANGLVAPKPAFTGNASSSTALPSDVTSATLTGGSLQVNVTNNYTFDPLRPSAVAGSPRGFALITVTSGSTVVGKDSVDGALFVLPANGGTLARSIPLSGAISGASPLTMNVTLNSPSGDPVLIDASRSLVVTAAPANLKVASATVAVVNRQVSTSTNVDLSSIDSTIIRHVQAGALLMTVVNPFNITGTLTVRLAPNGGTPVVKSVSLATGTSAPSVSFSQSEIASLLGHNVTMTLSGAVNASGGAVTISPKLAVSVTTKLDLSLEVGG